MGEPQAHRNIAVLPIIGPSNGAACWLTLGEALEQQLLTVTEVSQGGSVPELAVINRADRPVLLLDGEELIGAKQNRVLNTTILLKERSETVVPVSCTEHGRWSYVSAAFSDSKVLMAHGHVGCGRLRADRLGTIPRGGPLDVGLGAARRRDLDVARPRDRAPQPGPGRTGP